MHEDGEWYEDSDNEKEEDEKKQQECWCEVRGSDGCLGVVCVAGATGKERG